MIKKIRLTPGLAFLALFIFLFLNPSQSQAYDFFSSQKDKNHFIAEEPDQVLEDPFFREEEYYAHSSAATLAPETPVSVWEKRDNESNSDQIHGLTTDSQNNVIITGLSDSSFYTIKYNSSGNKLWSQKISSTSHNEAWDVVVDSNDNIIVTGQAYAGWRTNFYTIKYDSSGNTLWSRSYDSGGMDVGLGVTVDSNDNIIVVGMINFSSTFDHYIIKYDANGNTLWSKKYDSGNIDLLFEVATDSQDNIILAGGVIQNGNQNAYLAKYNSNGHKTWEKIYDGGKEDTAYGVAVDSGDNIVWVGFSKRTDKDWFVTKYDSSGHQIWQKFHDSGQGDDGASDVTIDQNDDIIVTGDKKIAVGSADRDFQTIKYDSGGNQMWQTFFNGPDNLDDYSTNASVDTKGDLLIGGGSRSTQGGFDYYTIKYELRSNAPVSTRIVP